MGSKHIVYIVEKDGDREYRESVLVEIPPEYMHRLRLIFLQWNIVERVTGIVDDEWYSLDGGERWGTVHHHAEVSHEDWDCLAKYLARIELSKNEFDSLVQQEQELASSFIEEND